MSFRKLGFLVCALLCLPISGQATAELTQTLKRINDSGEINLGYRKDQTPMSFDQDSNKPAGYSVELCNRIAVAVKKALGRSDIKINYVPVTAESRFDAIQSGEIDILCGATTKTLSRSEIVGFTQHTFVTGGALLSRKDAVVENIKELEGKRVAVVSNTTTIDSLKAAIDALYIDVEVVAVGSTSEGMAMVERGEVDAFAADQVVLIGQVIASGGRKTYTLSRETFSFEPFALAIPRGDADFQLVADRVLSRLNRSGEIIRIYKKWFGSFGEKPPSGLIALYQLNSTPP
ncbi:MAG: amino acid ABC transporter substrate-binding protein [Gammaproteobacteria bacterium]|nr:amino acid ABC transporter substrate-binding protein [Gammaproteobacteria bacterium]